MRDPYEVLGIQRGATDDEIKKAYRAKCKRWHPDLNPNDPTAEEHFKEVQAAYDAITKGDTGPQMGGQPGGGYGQQGYYQGGYQQGYDQGYSQNGWQQGDFGFGFDPFGFGFGFGGYQQQSGASYSGSDSPEMQAAMRQYHALEKFSCKQNWWGDSIQKFAEGKTAMTVIYSNYAAELINSGNSVVVGRVGAAILPGCKPLLGGGIVGISRYSQKAEACKQFFHWYYSADVASLLVRLGGTSPIVDAYEDFQNYSIFPWMNTSKKSFGLGQRGVINQTPERFSIPKYEFAVGTAVRNVVQDLMTPEDASRMAQALYDAADPVCR